MADVLARRGGFEDDTIFRHVPDSHLGVVRPRPGLQGIAMQAAGDEPSDDHVGQHHEDGPGCGDDEEGHRDSLAARSG